MSLTGTDYSEEAEKLWEAYESALVKEFAEHRVAVKLGGLDVSYKEYSAAMYEEYYKKMYAVLDNQIKIYRSKANMTTEEGLQYTQKLREAEVKQMNLDDEIAETNLEIAKLKGATVEEQIALTEEIRDTSDTELEYLQRVQDVNEAQKQRVELLKAQKELINKEYYEIYQSVLGINNVSAAYFENITRNIEKQIEELENYLNTAQNLSEIDTLNV